jgi:hypothetical protein
VLATLGRVRRPCRRRLIVGGGGVRG